MTDQDQWELNRYILDYYRAEYANEGKLVYKSGSQQKEKAFKIRLLDDLKANLEYQLSTALRKKALLKRELTTISGAINAAGKTINGWEPALANEIVELRQSLELNYPYNFAHFNEEGQYKTQKLIRLAQVWDIVDYEAHLKNTLFKLKRGALTFTNSPNESPVLSGHFEHISKYKKVMELLVAHEYCQPGTYVWIDTKNGYKKTLVILIKHLHAQGFYKDNIIPSNAKIVEMIKNTFGVIVGIDTVKKTDGDNAIFSFICPATTY